MNIVVPANAGTQWLCLNDTGFLLARLARAITDTAISQDERRAQRLFSLSAQIMRQREAYYAVLERTQRGTLNVTDWLGWFLEQVASA